MRYARLVEYIALAREAKLLVERHGLQLRMQVRLADAAAAGLVEESAQYQRADTPAAHPGTYRYAADLTHRIKSPGADWFTVQGREDMDAQGVLFVPFVGFGDPLLEDEDFTADSRQDGAIRVPVGDHTF